MKPAREAFILDQQGGAEINSYALPEAEIVRFFRETPKADLTRLFEQTFFEPVTHNGLSLDMLRQGSVFTHAGKQSVPGPGDSYGTAHELMR